MVAGDGGLLTIAEHVGIAFAGAAGRVGALTATVAGALRAAASAGKVVTDDGIAGIVGGLTLA